MTESNKLGFYGKIPTNGDFVSRHLPRTFVDPWDQWLQESIATSREQLAEQWLDRYLTGPIWRFALSKRVCNDKNWVGLLMPSVDRVGRYFPLTLAVPVEDACSLISIADNEAPWFSQVEHIALSALDQTNNLDSFNQDIENLSVPDYWHAVSENPTTETAQPEFASSENWRVAMTGSDSISSNLSSLMEQFLLERFPDFTLWWTDGSEQVEPSILICNNLPPRQGFSALLTGNWEHWGSDNKLYRRRPAATVSDDQEKTTSVTP